MSALEDVLKALEAHGRVRRQAGYYMAQCPAHEDRCESLSVRGVDGKVLLKCHANCQTADVAAALGMRLADLFDETEPRDRPVTVAEYPYTDEHGTLLYTVERRVPKTFRMRAADGSYKLTGVRRVLYRLPEVAVAVADGRTIYLVEGEKDADNLTAAGAVATCNPNGAGKWRDEYSASLIGAHVVVIADADKAGRAHAQQIAASLAGKTLSTTLAEPAYGKDVTDHLAHGLDLANLAPFGGSPSPNGQRPAATPSRTLRLTPASAIAPRRVRWLWHGRLALGTLGLLAGREGLGKSTVAAWLISRITRGMLPGELDDDPRTVIIAATEDSWEFTIVPRLIAAGADLDLVYRCDVQTSDDSLSSISLPADNRDLERLVRDAGAALIVLDPLMSRIDAHLDTHRDAEVRQALEPVLSIAERTEAVLLGLIHLNKGMHGDPLTAVMGSRAFTAVARSVLMVAKSPDEDGTVLLGQPKNNLGRADNPTLKYRVDSMVIGDDSGPIETGRIEWCGETQVTIDEALRASADPEGRTAVKEAADWLADYLHMEGGAGERSEIIKKGAAAGHSKTSLDRARSRLGLVVESRGFPRRSLWVTAEARSPVIPEGQERDRYV